MGPVFALRWINAGARRLGICPRTQSGDFPVKDLSAMLTASELARGGRRHQYRLQWRELCPLGSYYRI
ncbi:MAG: hypothetical protein BroJett013_09580 [Alphaproteobacteria bacterium]|nr:MAG: hypothetical protein BroJett013_09580 [Alphaproteobacteria bacterium]